MKKAIVNYLSWVVFLSLALAAGVADADIYSGLMAHWKFDETSGTTASDSSGNNLHATLMNGAFFTAGQIRNGVEMDGTDGYVDLPIGSLISSLTNSTFATWANFSNEGGAWQRIFDIGTGTTVNMFLTPRIGTAEPMRFAITVGGGGDPEQQATAPSTLASGWHHVAVTIDADSGTISLYLDGAVVADNTAATLTPSDLGNTTQNWLGRSQYAADAYYDGSLDDFRIYDRALSTEDIVELMAWAGGAAAGPDQRVEAGQTVTLSGSGPADATSITWEQIITGDEPTVTLADPSSLTTTFTPPVREIGYILSFCLTVVSPTEGTTTDECLVYVTAPNEPRLSPANFLTYPGHLSFRLEWDPLVDAEQYGVGFKMGTGYFWFWTTDPFYDLVSLEEGAATVVVVKARNSYGDGPLSEEVTLVPMQNYALPDTLGGTIPPSDYVTISGLPVSEMNNTVIQDDSNDSGDGNAKSEDYWGYLWDQLIYFDHVTYFTGDTFWDGGWFLDLRVQYTEDGTTWMDVPTRISPQYDFTDQREGRQPYKRYDLYIPVLRGTGIRIFGTPGGMGTFTSISELEVFGDQATVRPLVVQGIDAVVPEGSTATLDGRLSFSTRGPLSGFAWVQTEGPTVDVTNSDQAVATFTAPGVDADTTLTFEFTAGDGTDTDTDGVTITVKNLLTAAVAGVDQTVYEGTPVTLDGTGSTTTSGNITYSWTQTEGTEATLTGANTATPSFTAPAVWDYNDDLVFELTVDDGVGGVSTDTVTVNVKNFMEGDIPGDPWGLKAEDIYAATLVPGETTYDAASDTYTVTADGSDIWDTADNFRYLYLQASGNLSVSVCMVTPFPPGTYIYAKAGVMVRQNNTPGSAEVHQVSTWQTGGEFQWRDSQGAATTWTGVAEPPHPLSHPFWLRIRREGDTWYGDYSYDGENWEHQAAAQHDVAMADPVLVGICLCSNEPGFLTTVEFTDFRVNDQGPPRPTILPDAYAVRTLSGGYQAGATADTSLSVRINPDSPPDTITVTENIPTGLSVVPGSVTHGGTIVGNTIAWTLTGGGVTELAYSLNVPGDASGALNFAGSVSFPGTTVDIYGDDIVYEVPAAPPNLAAELLLAAHLSWSASPEEGVVSYRVYRSVNGQAWEQIGLTSNTSFTDTAVVEGNTYNYQIAAVNAGGVEGSLSSPTGEKTVVMETREAEDFNYGGGLWPWTSTVTTPAVEAATQDDLDPGNDFWHPDKGGPKDYRPLDDIGIWAMAVYGVPGRGVGWVDPGSWWRYTFEVPEPGPNDPEGGWVMLVFRVEWPSLTSFAAYWDEELVGTVTFTTGAWGAFTDIATEQFQTTPGLHTLRVEAQGTDPNVDVLDFDKIGIGFNWTKPTREDIFADDFEDYTTLYSFADLVAAGYTVNNGSGVAEGAWLLWNTAGNNLGNEPPDIESMTNNYVITDSDLSGSVDVDEELITPVIDCTQHTKVRLDFNKNYRTYPDDEDHNQTAEVDIRSSDDGVIWGDWVTLLHYDRTTVTEFDTAPEQDDLSAHADGQHIQIRWRFYEANFDYWFAIDDVRVSGDKKPAGKGNITGVVLDQGKVGLTWEPFGDENYTVEFTENLTADDWQPVAGFTWPIAETTWSGEDIGALGDRYYRVRSE